MGTITRGFANFIGSHTQTPSFHAYGNSIAGAASSTWTVIPLQSENFDNGGCFNNTSSSTTLNGLTAPAYSFTPNVAGKYKFEARMVGFDNGNAMSNCRVGIYRNGTRMAGGYQWVTSGSTAPVRHYDPTLFATYDANGTGDYFQMYYYIAGASTLYLSADADTPQGISFRATRILE